MWILSAMNICDTADTNTSICTLNIKRICETDKWEKLGLIYIESITTLFRRLCFSTEITVSNRLFTIGPLEFTEYLQKIMNTV